jgi:hypothetical protein
MFFGNLVMRRSGNIALGLALLMKVGHSVPVS